MNEKTATTGTFWISVREDVIIYPVDAVDGKFLENVYHSAMLAGSYLTLHRESCGEVLHMVGYGAMAPEDVEEHFGLELGTEVLLGFYRACEAQFNKLSPANSSMERVQLAFDMMERAHDALAMAMAKRKMAL